ncbi:MAG: DNA polymerase III subunit delta' [Anaerolineae bacterium]
MASSWPIVGHRWAVQQLQHAVEHGEVPQALLITGPDSVGKRTLALTLVAAMLCRSDENRPCGECLACRKLDSGNHPDFMHVKLEDDSAHLRIDQIRQMERFLALTPKESERKIALASDFERATTSAANALLKTLEEPPRYANLILLATDADLLLPTIVSRSQQINLRPLSSQEVAGALTSQWQVEEQEAQRLARMSGGRIGWAVRAATHPEFYQKMMTASETLVSALGQDLPSRFETAETLAHASAELQEILEYWMTFWRDILLIQMDNAEAVVHQELFQTLSHIAKSVSAQVTVEVLNALEQSLEGLMSNANTQLLTENLLLNLPTVRTRK